jgi:LysR family transcriptional regulator, cyn operon transcriptional activator
MDLRWVAHFVAIAEAGSMALAARRLHVSQPALSRQIRELERFLGVQLFDRIGRRIVLAADGREMLARSRRLLAEAESLRERGVALGGGKGGVLRVGATPQLLEAAMPQVLALYRRRHPEVEIRLVEGGGDRLLYMVEHGEIHLAIPSLKVAEPLRSALLYPLRVLAVMSRQHPLASRRVLTVSDLQKHTLLILGPEFQTRQLFEAACSAARAEPPVLLESQSPQSLIALAAAGHGVAIVPSTVRLSRTGISVAGLVDGTRRPLGGWVRVVWDPRRYLPPHGESFLTILVESMRHSYPGHHLKLTREVRRPAATDALTAHRG